MKQLIKGFLFAFCTFLFNAQINAQTSADYGDAHVTQALRQINVPYKLDDTGDYKVTLMLTGNRSQIATIYSETFKSYGVEMRSIYSVATVSRRRPSPEMANFLLEQNAIDPGAWGVVKTGDGKFELVNVIYISADAGGEILGAALRTITKAAGEMKERLTKER